MMNWQIGDKIGIATTSRSESTLHTITSISGNTIGIDPSLKYNHMGGIRDIEGYKIEMSAEVVNLHRSVVITGDHGNFAKTSQGFHTGTFFNDNLESEYDISYGLYRMLKKSFGHFPAQQKYCPNHFFLELPIAKPIFRYARLEHCGQRDVLGRYCFHYHLKGTCRKCILKVSLINFNP